MIQKFVDRFMERKPEMIAAFMAGHPAGYREIVEAVIRAIADESTRWNTPDPTRVHEIDDGEYQGTLVYVIAETGYQPFTYWYVRIAYGSCGGCDTLESIVEYSSGSAVTKEQAESYWTLALHIVQGLKQMDDQAA